MLPPELVQQVLDRLDLFSVVSLSQTCRAWNRAITEAEYEYMLIRNCPWFQLSNSNQTSWKDCVMEHLRRYKQNSSMFDQSIIGDLRVDTNVQVKTDEFLPPNFHALGKMTLTKDGWHDDLMLRTTDSGFVFDGQVMDLSGSGVFQEECVFEEGVLVSKYRIAMKPQTDRPIRIISVKASQKCTAAIVCYEPNEYRILFKNADTSGLEPDIDFCMNSDEWLYSVGFTPSNLTSFELFLVDTCMFVYTEQRGYLKSLMALNNGVMERVLFDQDELTSSPKMLCAFDGKLAFAGKQIVPEGMRFLFNRTAMHATSISQDCLFSDYVGLYNSLGGMTHLVDFKGGRIVDVTAFYYSSFQPGHLAIPGLVSGELVIYRYSHEFLLTHFPHIDVQTLLTKLVWLVDAPEIKRLPNLTKKAPQRGQRHRQHRRVAV